MSDKTEIPFNPEDIKSSTDMNEIVGKKDILFLCLDTLRYDVALKAQKENLTPNLNKYGDWVKSVAPGNFTYPSHHAMFAGFLPAPVEARSIKDRELLFFPSKIGMGYKSPPMSFAFEGSNWIQGLEKVGYHTLCIGGVGFFDKRSPIGSVFPNMFKEAIFKPSFACPIKDSATNQIDATLKAINKQPKDKRVMAFINFSAIHYPNAHYVEGKKNDDVESHLKALEYVDSCLPRLFDAFSKRGGAFCMASSDHGTCYGEDGFMFHGFNHEAVNTIPYKHFIIE